MPASVEDTFDVSYALVNHEDLQRDHILRSGPNRIQGVNEHVDESLVMGEISGIDLKPNDKGQEPRMEEEKFYDLSHTESNTRAMTNPFISRPGTTSKKRSREEISGEMSLYDHVVISQREAAGNQPANAFRNQAEEEGMKRVHARDLEMHMKSKK